MSIILATTTITVRGVRPQSAIDPDAAGYDNDPPTPVKTVLVNGLRACISDPISERNVDKHSETDEYVLRCDLFDAGLNRYDTVIDEKTGQVYEVRVVAISPTDLFGLEHFKVKLRKSEGLANVAITS